MTKKNRIVIAQTHRDVLDKIMRAGDYPGFEMVCTTDPSRALSFASLLDTRVLITGQLFYGDLNHTEREVAEELALTFFDNRVNDLWNERQSRVYGNLEDGNELARMARAANPELIVLRYSSLPEGIDPFCGELNKYAGVSPIKNLLEGGSFIEVLDQKRKANLPQMPNVRWYEQNFPQSWN